MSARLSKEVHAENLRLLLGGHRWIKLDMFCQNDDPRSEGYVSAYAGKDTRLEPVPRGRPTRPHEMMSVAFRIPGGVLSAGTRLRFVLGDQVYGSRGIRAPNFACKNVFMAVAAEPSPGEIRGHGVAWVCAFVLDITGGALNHLKVIAPSTVARNSEFAILVRPQDKYGNISPEKPAQLVVESSAGTVLVDTRNPPVNPAGAIEIDGLSLDTETVTRIRVRAPREGLVAESNPIIPTRGEHLLWGLIHEHTELSDGAGSIDLCYNNMKFGSRLDFGSVTDHDHRFETTEDMWQATIAAAERYNQEGDFITLLGYEWAKWRRNGDGDRNVYYAGGCGPMLRSETGEYDRPDKLFQALKEHDALVVPHHTAYEGNFCDWTQHDPEKERLVEIYSVWGSSETSADDSNPFPVRNPRAFDPLWILITGKKGGLGEEPVGFVRNALRLGWRVGFTAGGDMHLSHPGEDYRKGHPPYDYKAGLTAVWCGEKTRRSLWSSLAGRRCYATTGSRIVLRFTVNGHPMGSEVPLNGPQPRKVELEVYGTNEISSAEVIRNNQVIRVWRNLGRRDVRLQFIDTDPPALVALPQCRFSSHPFLFYYLRVRQVDGEMAWSSPVWLDLK